MALASWKEFKEEIVHLLSLLISFIHHDFLQVNTSEGSIDKAETKPVVNYKMDSETTVTTSGANLVLMPLI